MSMPQVVSRAVLRRAGSALARCSAQQGQQAIGNNVNSAYPFAARSLAAPAKGAQPQQRQRGLTRALSSAAAPAVAEAPTPIYLSDYAPPDYKFVKVALDFDLGEEQTIVGNTLNVEPTYDAGGASRPLFLHGRASHYSCLQVNYSLT